jgi:O-antigen/teichoic acid export membrane protein
MGVIRKQSTYTTVILYLGIVVGFIGTALIRPKLLSEGEIGLLQIVLNTTALFAGVFTFGSNLITLKMFPKVRTDDNANRGLLSLILLIGIVGSVLTIPVFFNTSFFFFQNNEGEQFDGFDFSKGFYLGLVFVIIARLFQNILDGYLRAHHNSVLGVFSESIVLKVFPIVGLVLFYIGWIDFQVLVYFNMGIFILPLLLTLMFLKRLKVFRLTKIGPFSSEEKREMKGVASVGLFEIIAGGVILYIDTIMLQWMIGEEAVGIYTTLFFFGLVVGIPGRGITRVAVVIIAEAFAVNDLDKIQSIYKKSSDVLMVISGYVFLMIWGNRYSVEQYLDPVYAQGIYVMLFIGLAQFIDVIASVNYQIIIVSKYYYYNLILVVVTVLLLIVSNYYFIQWYGLVGAAIGSAISMFIMNVIRFVFLKMKFGLSPFSINSLKSIILFIVAFVMMELIPNYPNLYINLFVKGTIISLVFLPAAYFFRCSEDINNVANKYLNKLGVKWNR